MKNRWSIRSIKFSNGLAPLILCLVGLAAYANSFTVPFVFDGHRHIIGNENIRKLWPVWRAVYDSSRPLTYLTFAVNYAFGELDPLGYHVVNLMLHVLGGVALFGLVWRTLQLHRAGGYAKTSARAVALVSAASWVAHPLQTETVVNIYQRSEALMSLWYLMTLYAVLRGATSPKSSHWYVLAIISCALGMASKPIMVTAPLMALCYDRTFLSGSFKKAWRLRRELYTWLAVTWGLLPIFLVGPSIDYAGTGFTLADLSPWEYLRSQPGVILYYLRLVVWPHPLVLDYAWPIAHRWFDILPQAFVIGFALFIAVYLWRRRMPQGFLGLAFFLLLAPTSSLIPIADLAVEHRMYLPLAPVLIAVVLAMGRSMDVLRRGAPQSRKVLATMLACLVITVFGAITYRRNADYLTDEAIWRDTVAKRPHNSRAWYSLAMELERQERLDEAVAAYNQTFGTKRLSGPAHNDVAIVLMRQGKLDQAFEHLLKAVQLLPEIPEVWANVGNLFEKQRRFDAAERAYVHALLLDPKLTKVYNNLGALLGEQGRYQEAVAFFREALRQNPADEYVRANLTAALEELDKKSHGASQ